VHSVGDRIINEYGAAGGMKIGRGTEVLGEKPALCHFLEMFYYES
jgi:hypothetical protein